MSNRTPLLAGNWKMHGTAKEAAALIDALKPLVSGVTGREVLVAPPFSAIAAVAGRLSGTNILLSAQNLHWEDRGAFTGEISGPMLRDAGCTHVIVGHSERRQLFGETDEIVARKTVAALKHDLTPIVCVGETLAEREADRAIAVIDRQVRAVLGAVPQGDVAKTIVAYEPVWAIGTGKVATPEQAQEVHAAIRGIVASVASEDIARRLRILYGGSVKPDNIDTLMRQPDLDGALVGGASLKAEEFARIVRFQA